MCGQGGGEGSPSFFSGCSDKVLRLVLAWVRELWCLGRWAGIPTIGAGTALAFQGSWVCGPPCGWAGLGWKVQHIIEGLCFPPSLVHTTLSRGEEGQCQSVLTSPQRKLKRKEELVASGPNVTQAWPPCWQAHSRTGSSPDPGVLGLLSLVAPLHPGLMSQGLCGS